MRKIIAYIFCVIGFGWAIIGGANIVMAASQATPRQMVFIVIINFLLFFLPGLSLGAKGVDWLKPEPDNEIRKFCLLIPLLLLTLTSCADSGAAKQFLDERGFTQIKILGPSLTGGCVKSNFHISEFEAISPEGKKVSGQVCTDLVGGGDIHLEWKKR